MSKNNFALMLPFPPSNNNLHKNVSKTVRPKTKNYVNWIKEADGMATQQKPFVIFDKRVDVTVYLGGGASNYDCDNFNKAPQDFIVRLGIIKDDSKPYVRSTKQIWCEETKGCMIFIEECDDNQ